jgi:hypothetical protein
MDLRPVWINLGWLLVLIVTIATPLALDATGRLTYFSSLVFWGIPLLYLWPVFLSLTASGSGRRRRALRWSAGSIATLGVVLDLVLGHLTFRFPGCDAGPGASPYVLCVPGLGGLVPVEELLFYVMGPIAIVLTYACADERWLARYHSGDDRLDVALIRVSPGLVALAALAAVAAIVLWRVNGTFPTYFAFLTAGAILPALFLYRAVAHLTNWQGVALTTLYVLLTSVIWEVTLAIPRDWWGYEPSGMAGVVIAAWSRGAAIFPLEAAVVWLTAPFSCILIYEFANAFFHHSGSTREALFGNTSVGEGPDRLSRR